jgi:hypothetical protein
MSVLVTYGSKVTSHRARTRLLRYKGRGVR